MIQVNSNFLVKKHHVLYARNMFKAPALISKFEGRGDATFFGAFEHNVWMSQCFCFEHPNYYRMVICGTPLHCGLG